MNARHHLAIAAFLATSDRSAGVIFLKAAKGGAGHADVTYPFLLTLSSEHP